MINAQTPRRAATKTRKHERPCLKRVFVLSWFRGVMGVVVLASVGATVAVASLQAQVSFDRLLRAAGEPQNWLSYSGGAMSQRYSALAQVTPDNVKNLELRCEAFSQIFTCSRLLELFLQLVDSFFQLSGLFGRTRRLTIDFSNRFPRQKQPQINPHQPAEPLALFIKARR